MHHRAMEAVATCLRRREKGQAIAQLRGLTGLSLQASKDAVRALAAGSAVELPLPRQPASEARSDAGVSTSSRRVPSEVLALLHQGRKIEAVKQVREALDLGLAEAVAYVEQLQATQAPEKPGGSSVSQEKPLRATPAPEMPGGSSVTQKKPLRAFQAPEKPGGSSVTQKKPLRAFQAPEKPGDSSLSGPQQAVSAGGLPLQQAELSRPHVRPRLVSAEEPHGSPLTWALLLTGLLSLVAYVAGR